MNHYDHSFKFKYVPMWSIN